MAWIDFARFLHNTANSSRKCGQADIDICTLVAYNALDNAAPGAGVMGSMLWILSLAWMVQLPPQLMEFSPAILQLAVAKTPSGKAAVGFQVLGAKREAPPGSKPRSSGKMLLQHWLTTLSSMAV